jgi:hypothetical protein
MRGLDAPQEKAFLGQRLTNISESFQSLVLHSQSQLPTDMYENGDEAFQSLPALAESFISTAAIDWS